MRKIECLFEKMASASVQEQDLHNNVELFQHGQEALALALNNRPKNTSKNYDPKIKEWDVRETRVWHFVQTNADLSTEVLQQEKIQ